jgi:hypothetical protein
MLGDVDCHGGRAIVENPRWQGGRLWWQADTISRIETSGKWFRNVTKCPDTKQNATCMR